MKLILQVLVSACLLVFVFRQINLDEVRSLTWSARGLPWLLGALLLFNLSKITSAWRLNLYQRHAGIRLGERENLMLYYAGMFLNLFLPGGIGGDGYKILVLHRRGTAPIRTLLWVTLIDRISGLLILALLACMLVPFLDLPWPAETTSTFAGIGGTIIILIILLAHYRMLNMDSKDIASVCGRGVAVQLLQLVCMAMVLAYLQVPVHDYPAYLWVFLVSSVAAALPLSFGGLGARELTFLYALQMLRLESTQGVVASSFFFLITVFSSLAGAPFLKKFALGDRKAS
jgi:glycosyltransferase 2 family protein